MSNSTLNDTILSIALLAISAAAIMVFGSSLGFWEPIVGFAASRQYNDYIGWGVVAISIFGILYNIIKNNEDSHVIKPLFALVLGLVILSTTIMNFFVTPVRYPPIHDITTNISNPPEFIFLNESRPGAKNSLVYGGQEVADQQLTAFPSIKPIITTLSPDKAYEKALNIASSMGWEMVSTDPTLYHFESTARTRFFNFADDVVVQVVKIDNGSRVDIRSVSRIGRGDRGMNAQRIIAFTEQFEK